MNLRGSPESAGNALSALRTSFALRSYILLQQILPSMTTTTPRHRLWHPTRGIAFSPGPRSPASPVQATRALSDASFPASRERPLRIRKLDYQSSGGFRNPVRKQPVASIETAAGQKAAPGARNNEAASGRELLDEVTKDPPFPALDFKMMDDMFYAAKNAPAGSPESFWSYTHFRRTAEDGTEQKVKVHYCRSTHTMERICQQYFMDEEVLGFDLEWIADSSRWHGLKNNISLIQLASPSRIGLFHVALFPDNDDMVGPSFRTIMEDAGITKVGVAIKGDTTRLRNHLDIHSRGLMELSHLYKLVTYSSKGQYHNINKRLVPLATQVQEYLHLPLFKGHDIRSSDWTKALTMDQIIYSASDAYAGLHLYAILEHHRKQLDPCPPTPYHAERNLPIRLAEGVELATRDEPVEATEDTTTPGPSAATSETYVASVLESIKIEDIEQTTTGSSATVTATATATVTATATATTAKAKKSPRSGSPAQPKDSRVEACEDRAAIFRASRPRTRATFAALRAYYLWHCHDLDPDSIARLLRDPPLKTSTVTKYILSAIKAEHLPLDEDRLHAEVVSTIPPPFMRLWYPAVLKFLATGRWEDGGDDEGGGGGGGGDGGERGVEVEMEV
ncbi:hypothetical protein F5X99DRAFT_213259 [Biscogniauxia marginata]|nr:hypothetical protein F5X99DRAFT_213259 [Biscogniauxia marginata]